MSFCLSLQLLYVFRECNKLASVLTLCALSVDRFLAAFHHFGRFRQIRVGTLVCGAIWTICFASSTPYWMFASVVQSRPLPNNLCIMATINNTLGNTVMDVCCASNNNTIPSDIFDSFPTQNSDNVHGIFNVSGIVSGSRLARRSMSSGTSGEGIHEGNVSGEIGPPGHVTVLSTNYSCHSRLINVSGVGGKLSCRMNWPRGFRKSWTYVQLVLGVIIPLVAIAIFNGLLLRRLHQLNAVRVTSVENRPMTSSATMAADSRHQQHIMIEYRRDVDATTTVTHRGASRVRRLTSVSRMMLVVVTVFSVCQLPYHIMEIVSLVIEDSRRLPSPYFAKVFIYCNMVAQIMVFLSSCINPIIYGVFNKNYRESLFICKQS